MQALREELDAANKKIDRYAYLVAALSEELDNLRRCICRNCKKKFIPSYTPDASSSNGRRPSLWRRIVSPGGQMQSPASPVGTTYAGGSSDTSIPIYPIPTAISASPQASSSATSSQPSTTPVDEIRSEQPSWSLACSPEIEHAFHIEHVKTFSFPTGVFCAKFSPNGKYLAAGLYRTGKTYIFDLEHGSINCCLVDLHLESQPIIWCAQFSPDNRYIATGGSDSRIRLWEIARKRIRAVFADHDLAVYAISFSPNGRFLVAGDGDGAVRIWSLRDGSSKNLITDASSIFWVTFSPDGRHIVSVDDTGWLRIWDARTGKMLNKWKGHPRGFCVAFSSDGKGLVSGGEDAILRYWDVSSLAETGRARMMSGSPGQGFPQILKFEGHSGVVGSVSISPDRRWVVTISLDESVRIWDARNGRCLLRRRDGYGRVDFCPTGKYLATGGENRQVMLWRYREV